MYTAWRLSWLQPCINDIDNFIIPTNAHNVKNLELLKRIKIMEAAYAAIALTTSIRRLYLH